MSNSHKQVPAKITQYVDSGVKELVELINSFTLISTTSSCEGTNGKFRGHVYIQCSYDEVFGFNDTPMEQEIPQTGILAEFSQILFNTLHKHQFIDRTKEYGYGNDLIGDIKLELSWDADELNCIYKYPTLILDFPTKRLKELTSIIKEYSKTIAGTWESNLKRHNIEGYD
jgi:hypothetical protein